MARQHIHAGGARTAHQMDLLILSCAFFGFWTKYLDNGNLTNAYVSGMKEDLGFYRNQFVQLQIVYTVAYTVFIISLTLLATKYRNVIPACDLMWVFSRSCNTARRVSANWPCIVSLAVLRVFIPILSTTRSAPSTGQMSSPGVRGSSTCAPVSGRCQQASSPQA
jgi:hypothetical protein